MAERRLGLRPPKNAPALMLGSVLTGTVPAHPATADHFAEVTDWGLFGNDRYGDCGPTSVANYVKLVTKYLTGTEVTVTQDDVFDLYRRSGNPGFDPATDADDNGVDMQTMLEALAAGGIGGGHKPVAFAKVDTSNLDEVRAAIAIFGGVLFGVNLQTAQQTQTDDGGPWDYHRSGEWGGHAVLAGRYTSAASGTDVSVVTWAEVMGTTDAFLTHQLSECWVLVLPEHLTHPDFLAGVDQAALAADYEALTGRPFPSNPQPPQPTPGPAPVPADADHQLVAALTGWLSTRHTGSNQTAAKAVRAWMVTKGLGTAVAESKFNIADLIRVTRVGRDGFELTIDGETFPYALERGQIDAIMTDEPIGRLRVTILTDRLEFVDDQRPVDPAASTA